MAESQEPINIGSFRRNGSVWSRSGDIFSRSSRFEEDDDEEALRWAALEKLPTYDRIRKGILMSPEGKHVEIDVKNMGKNEKKALIERLVRVPQDDNERFLLKLKDRIDRVGLQVPTIEVRFENLNIKAEAYVGNRGLPTFLNATLNSIESLANILHILPSKKRPMSILHNVSGIVKPGRMTLLLGPPGSGKTTLLLALAGKLDSSLKVSGKVTYNGHEMNEFVPERTAAYISQHDLHLGELTVRETLSFSARCQGVGPRYDMLMELSKREKAANIKPDPDLDVFMKATAIRGQEASVATDYILKILGLDVCADIMVGNEMIRGISGGQRKRVTTGEMLVGPSGVFFMDEISTGLDSSTTFQIIKSLKETIHIIQATAVISLLQPAPETYDLFDDIILISDGLIVYQGPRENVLEFFESMGFKCPKRKGVADFLQEVTSKKDQQQYWAHSTEPYKYIPVKQFCEAFNASCVGQKILNELAVPFDKNKGHPAALTTQKYGVGKKDLLKANIDRELLLMKRNSFVYIFRATQLLMTALITMTVFMRTDMHRDSVTDGGIYMGALFFSIIAIMFTGMADLALTIMNLPVFFKQRDLRFYPAWAYSIPTWIVKIPITFVEVGTWVFLLYFVVGFDPNIASFVKQYMILLGVNQMAVGLFRFIGGLSRDMIVANTVGSFALLVVMVLGGFILSHDNIKKWWMWGYWISPLMYAQNAISTNEFLGHSWSKIIPGSSDTLGVLVLKSRGVFPEANWFWIGFGALIGYIFLFNSLFTLALSYLEPFGKSQPIVSEEALKEKQANIIGEIKEGSTTQIKNIIRRNKSNSVIDISNSSLNKKGMVLPFKQLALTFDNIRYSVDMPQEMKAQGVTEDRLVLLKGVSGSFRPGVLTALMGVSGAGKTTLMDVLAGRKTGGYVEGSITISGYPKKQETFARVSGYCEQNDIHSPHLTIYESVVFSAWLRLPSDVDSASQQMFVEEVMELVELNSLRDSLVGLPGVSGLSTEQRKRLTIAVELVANPSIIFMDEPTSGLDARAAAIVMRAVRNTVDTGRTVVCTIHQPSIDIFESFDELFLMKRGGEEIYVGPLGCQSAQLIKYFEAVEGVNKIKDGYNPATWMLEITTPAQEEILGVDFCNLYKKSTLFQRNKSLIKDLSSPPAGSSDLHFETKYSQSFFMQCMACLWKQNISYWRNPPYTAVRFYFTVAISLLFGSLFWDLGSRRSKQQDLFNAMGSMHGSVLFLGIQNASSVQPVVSVERTVFYRERAAGMYSALPYAFGQVIIEIPYVLVQALVYGVIVYAMIGFEWTVVKFLSYIFFMYFTLLYFTYYGMLSVGVTPNHQVASIASSAFYSVWNLFSGFMIPRPADKFYPSSNVSIKNDVRIITTCLNTSYSPPEMQKKTPVWWRWYVWLCPVAWTLYGLLSSQFGDVNDTLESGQTVAEFMTTYFGFHHDFLSVVAVVVVAFAVLFAFLFAFSIQKFNFQRR